jgi:phytoene dehydrogenase-like protein
MYYGSPTEHDIDFFSFVILFKSIFLEGFARPPDGVRTIIKALVRSYRQRGGELRMQCGVDEIEACGDRAVSLRLADGSTITADVVLSCAGYAETLHLCPMLAGEARDAPTGRVSFIETIALLDRPPAVDGHGAAIVFFNDEEKFTYAVPDGPADLRSGVICCPTNYEDHDHVTPAFRVTWLADPDRWEHRPQEEYSAEKHALLGDFIARGETCIPSFRDRIVFTDVFTPRTIRHYTGHFKGAVYGSPQKHWDGRTPLKNLFVCGTDQGYLGIIGAMMSGVTMANMYVLSAE